MCSIGLPNVYRRAVCFVVRQCTVPSRSYMLFTLFKLYRTSYSNSPICIFKQLQVLQMPKSLRQVSLLSEIFVVLLFYHKHTLSYLTVLLLDERQPPLASYSRSRSYKHSLLSKLLELHRFITEEGIHNFTFCF